MNELVFKGGYAYTTTASGKPAMIWQNETNTRRVYYSMRVDSKTVLTRATMEKVAEKLQQM